MDQDSKSPSPELIRINQLRKAILHKTVEICKSNPGLDTASLTVRLESETRELFDQFHSQAIALKSIPLKPKSRRTGIKERKDHVGRFFLFLLETELRREGIQECLIPVFAKSIQSLIGNEAYDAFAMKISHLMEYGENNGFSYDQVLRSKSGKEIMQHIIALYRSEMSKNPPFAERLKNKLDEALVLKFKEGESESLDIDAAIKKAYHLFVHLIASARLESPK